MYGVPKDLDLTPFQGSSLETITLAPFIIHFRFAAEQLTGIGVEGDWELVSPDGTVVDHQMKPSKRDAYRIHVLLDRTVVGTEVAAPESFSLRFDNGYTLRVFDHSTQYESFSIQPGDIHV
jgi:hypothetical protein